MPRPRKDETRSHQINIRFTAREFARVHHHAGLIGKSPADFGRGAMLRRPRRRRCQTPIMITIGERLLQRWHGHGLALNRLAHDLNATSEPSVPELLRILAALRRLMKKSFPPALTEDTGAEAYSLSPLLRYHLRKTCTNLVQIADRADALGLVPPPALPNLILRFRTILNGDSPPHGA